MIIVSIDRVLLKVSHFSIVFWCAIDAEVSFQFRETALDFPTSLIRVGDVLDGLYVFAFT